MIYLDNAATSFPKPVSTVDAVYHFLTNAGANPGRSGHEMSVNAARIIFETRELVSSFFNAADPLKVVFTHNATYSINMVLKGMLKKGDRVVTTAMEHNSVMRPLRSLEKCGIKIEEIPCSSSGVLDPSDMEKALENKTDLIVMTAASNVTGTIMPVQSIGRSAKIRNIPFLVDASQAGGIVPLDMEKDFIDILAFTGHKSLYGPPGTGGLVFGKYFDIDKIIPLIEGGTGSKSESDIQPSFMPDKFESGTPNGAGLAGLGAGIKWINKKGLCNIIKQKQELTDILFKELSSIKGLKIYGLREFIKSTGVLSFTIKDIEVSELAGILDTEYSIMCRAGLHCAPNAHKTTGTYPAGTVRFSTGAFTTESDIASAVKAVKDIAAKKRM